MAKSFVGYGSIPSREYNTSGRLATQVLDSSIGSSVNTQFHQCTEDFQEWTNAFLIQIHELYPIQARYARRLAMWILAVAPHITLDTRADDDENGRIREIHATAVAAKAQLTSFPCEAHILRGL